MQLVNRSAPDLTDSASSVKYGTFVELVLRQHPTTSSDDFDALMRTAWLVPEVSNSGVEIKSMKDLRKLNVRTP